MGGTQPERTTRLAAFNRPWVFAGNQSRLAQLRHSLTKSPEACPMKLLGNDESKSITARASETRHAASLSMLTSNIAGVESVCTCTGFCFNISSKSGIKSSALIERKADMMPRITTPLRSGGFFIRLGSGIRLGRAQAQEVARCRKSNTSPTIPTSKYPPRHDKHTQERHQAAAMNPACHHARRQPEPPQGHPCPAMPAPPPGPFNKVPQHP